MRKLRVRHLKKQGKQALLSLIQAAGWPIWPLVGCSILALALVIERALFFRGRRSRDDKLLAEVMRMTSPNLPSRDMAEQLDKTSMLGAVLASALKALIDQPQLQADAIKDIMERAGRQAAQELDRALWGLATIASVAPLLGLLGTVIGMIDIFGSQADFSAALAAAPTAGSSPSLLAHGISVALYNTAFGLIIAIPSVISWRYFRTKTDAFELQLEQVAQRFYQHIKVHCHDQTLS